MSICYAFEAKSIQEYILNSGKLKDMVGASEIVDQLVGEPLDEAIRVLGLKEEIDFSRRAGGSFICFLDSLDKARALRDLWSLIVPRFAPGLSFVHTLCEGPDKLESARAALAKMQKMRIPMPEIPSATPLTRYSPRTGLPATCTMRGPDGNEWVDAATFRKRSVSDRNGLAKRFSGADLQWPKDMEKEFPFPTENRYVGIVHADGNGLGQLLQALQEAATPQNYCDLYLGFSQLLQKSTCDAARIACHDVLFAHCDANGYMPARPLVLGGDDLTVIVRADLAMDFTRAFLSAFEEKSRDLCTFVKKQANWTQDYLTAAAGIAYVKAGQPFAMAYSLAEELCSQAKQVSNREASAVSFHRVSTSFIPDLRWMINNEMTTHSAGMSFVSTLRGYSLGAAESEIPALDALQALRRHLSGQDKHSGTSRMRRLLGILQEPPQEAERMYQRWRSLIGDKQSGDPKWLDEFDDHLTALLGTVDPRLPARRSADAGQVFETPLGDILALDAVEGQA